MDSIGKTPKSFPRKRRREPSKSSTPIKRPLLGDLSLTKHTKHAPSVGEGCLRLALRHSREDIVDADDAVRPRGAAVVNDGGITLYPDPAAVLRQEPVVLGGHLPLHQH